MNTSSRPLPATIRQARQDNPNMRERDLAMKQGISEAELIAAWCGRNVARIKAPDAEFFSRLKNVGEVMALTRNRSAVHEKVGTYDKYYAGKKASMFLGTDIDLRIFPDHWVHGFAVEKSDDDGIRRSFQFFDAHGDAVHKIHQRQSSDQMAWSELAETMISEDQADTLNAVESEEPAVPYADKIPLEELRDRWGRMTDTHQFVSIIRKLNLSRHQAVRAVGDDFAWPVDRDSVGAMMRLSAAEKLPMMCFVGSQGCIQIHAGPISNIKTMGPWLNVMDPGFHLHLRSDHISEAWAVRKPTDKGHVTSLEAYDEDGKLIIQFFGKRIEGQDEREGWRFIVENLPRISRIQAA